MVSSLWELSSEKENYKATGGEEIYCSDVCAYVWRGLEGLALGSAWIVHLQWEAEGMDMGAATGKCVAEVWRSALLTTSIFLRKECRLRARMEEEVC